VWPRRAWPLHSKIISARHSPEIQEKLAQKPDDPLLLYMQADILLEQGAEPGSADFELAMRSAKRAVELRPSLGPAHGVLAKLYLKAGLNAEARGPMQKDTRN